MRDVDITVGADTSAVAAGMAEVRNTVRTTMGEIATSFAAPLSGAAILGFFEGVIEKAHQIHHEAERFGIDAQQLQLISNAANQTGISTESTARAMNRLEIATGAALGGNEQMAAAFGSLGISMLDFQQLNPAQKMLALADAVKQAGASTATYDAVAKILGARFGTELIPVLLQGSDAIKKISEASGIMSDQTAADLDKAYQTWKTVWNNINVYGAEAVDVFMKLWGAEGRTFMAFKDIVVGGMNAIGKAFHLDFAGAETEWKAGLEKMKADFQAAAADLKGAGQAVGLVKPDATAPEGAPRPLGEDITDASTNESKRGRSGGSGGGGSSGESEIDKTAEKTRRYYLESISASERVKELQKERNDLQDQLYQKQVDGNLADDEAAKIKGTLADLDHDIDKAQAEYNQKTQDALAAAQDEADAVEERNQQLRDTAQFGSQIAGQMAAIRDIEDQILDVTDQINQAWAEGDQKTAEALTNLRGQLETEEKLKQAAADRAKAISAYNGAAADTTAGTQSVQGGGLTTGVITDKRVQALIGAGYQLSDWAISTATDPRTGLIDPSRLAQQIIQYNRLTNFGTKNLDATDANRGYAANQALIAQSDANDRAAAAAANAYRINLGNSVNSALGQGGLDAVFNLPIFQQMLAQLEAMNAKLSPPPGSH